MRLPALIAILFTLAACSTPTKTHPYAEANSLMRQEIQARIANIPFQHRQELFNNLLWLASKGGESAIPDLLTALKHKEPKVRSSAAWVLGRIRDRRVIPELTPLARDESEAVRFEAARSLIMMGDMKYAPTLIEGLDSDKIPVRYNCHMALRDATARDFQYDHLEDDPAERRVAVLRWRQWWSEQSGDPWFARQYAQKHGLDSNPGDQPTTIPAKPMTEVKTQTQPEQPNQPNQPQPNRETQPAPTRQPGPAPSKQAPSQKAEGGESDSDPVKVEPWVQKVIEKVDQKDVPKPVRTDLPTQEPTPVPVPVPTPDPGGNPDK